MFKKAQLGIITNAFLTFIIPTYAFAFRGTDPCDYSDCSSGYGDIGFFGYLFFGSLLLLGIYNFFNDKEFRGGVLHVILFVLLVIVFPMYFYKTSKDISIVLVVVMYFVHKKVSTYLYDKKHKSDSTADPYVNMTSHTLIPKHQEVKVERSVNFENKSETLTKDEFCIEEKNEVKMNSKSSVISEINKISPKQYYVNYLSEPFPKVANIKTAKIVNSEAELLEAKSEVNIKRIPTQNEKKPNSKVVEGIVGVRVQREIKDFAEKDALLWKACLYETKDSYESSVILYRVTRTKFLMNLNKILIEDTISTENLEQKLAYKFCSSESEARKLAFNN